MPKVSANCCKVGSQASATIRRFLRGERDQRSSWRATVTSSGSQWRICSMTCAGPPSIGCRRCAQKLISPRSDATAQCFAACSPAPASACCTSWAAAAGKALISGLAQSSTPILTLWHRYSSSVNRLLCERNRPSCLIMTVASVTGLRGQGATGARRVMHRPRMASRARRKRA